MLKLKNITKSYKLEDKKITILNNLNISFRKKEFVCILGKSGCGKSTLLNILGLLDEDYEGKIYINSRNITKHKDYLNDKLLRDKIGFVFQDYNLIEDLTVYQNIELSLIIKGIKKRKEKVESTLKKCHIHHLKDKKAGLLSGGEKQRVSIARALVKNPDIILMDEPTG